MIPNSGAYFVFREAPGYTLADDFCHMTRRKVNTAGSEDRGRTDRRLPGPG